MKAKGVTLAFVACALASPILSPAQTHRNGEAPSRTRGARSYPFFPARSRIESDFRRSKPFAIIALQDFLICLVVIREAIILRVPAQFLARELPWDAQKYRFTNN